ncbi:MAG: heme ABC transporter ATP-binding protein [Gammaproteobacteria bacterium]
MALAARGLTLDLAGQRVLDAVDLAIEPGRVTAILGPNGAGKSSLLRLLCGDWQAGHGSVELDGRPLAAEPAARRARRLAVLPQQPTLGFAFTGREVVMLGRTPHATGRRRDLDIARAALASVGAQDLADRYYTELSGGEKQRIQLARVLAQIWEPLDAPRYLLLDEPTAAFDLAHQRVTRDALRALAGDGVGVAVVMHDLNLAARVGDVMTLMRAGRVVASGPPVTMMDTGLIREVFDVEVTLSRHDGDGPAIAIV